MFVFVFVFVFLLGGGVSVRPDTSHKLPFEVVIFFLYFFFFLWQKATHSLTHSLTDSSVAMKFTSLLLGAAALTAGTAHAATELTESNFEASLAGKNALVKFLAPW